ncbi:DsbE family thiol:disulfide interchange protein [Acuticoccus sediminis]|uniref:DsbE family thiol:disulfide interchange protein n=1 Tax=Acuticoccus sediminis TaxID=2184697 RepID=UPI001CFE5288|nr:DsbE family thiol:disulfide interchange protein [Acuticoccus sediminis]
MRASRLLLAVPLLVFAGLAAVFALRVGDGEDRSVIPSALIGRDAPATTFAALLPDAAGVDPATFKGKVTLVNIFASWCGPCRIEHPLLVELARTPGLTVVGIDYKDKPEDAKRFLAELGNPYDAVGVDPDGRGAIEWGLTGVPESFLIGPEGRVRAKHVGPLTEEALSGSFGNMMTRLISEHGEAAGS